MGNARRITDRVPQAAPQRGWLTAASRRRLAYTVMLLGAAGLALTGLGTVALRRAMSGWVLMLHASAAPLFAVGLALVSLTWSGHCRLGASRSTRERAANLLFWLILACGSVVILSGVVPMTPVFGTNGQRGLVSIHFYSAALLAGLLVLHVSSLVALRRMASDATQEPSRPSAALASQ